MITRFIESKKYLRVSVQSAEVISIGESSVVLKTFSIPIQKAEISSADLDALDQKQIKVGQNVEGIIRIDVCADDVLRIRYAEGSVVPDNATPMITGAYPPAKSCRINRIDNACGFQTEKITIATEAMEISINLNPYSIKIIDLESGNEIIAGGPEKNNFNNWDSVNTGLCYSPQYASPVAVESFSLAYDECVYGFGEKFLKLNKVGQTIDLNNEDALGVITPRTYKNIPFFVSTNGYGVFFNHSSLMTFWLGSMSACNIQVAIEDNFLDYFIFTGKIKKILKNYTALTGKSEVPPKWTFGYWQSKASYESEEETVEIVRKMRESKIPCDVIHLDTNWFKKNWYCDLNFDTVRFPDPQRYLKAMSELGVKVSLWQLPYIPEGSELFEKLKSADGFVKNKNGEIYDVKVCYVEGFKGTVGLIDYTNPKAVKIHQHALRELFRLGVKVIKTDFGEAAPLDGVYFDGTPGHRMHNLYPLLYNKAVFDVTKEETGDGVVWARSTWAGSQRYPVHWGGDSSAYFEDMEPQLAGGLSFGLSGFQFWSQDIGGFLGNTSGDLLIRWMQMSMFLSHCRIHGDGVRELYKFDETTMKICRDYIWLRYRLMPYIYGNAIKAVQESLPMARALVIEYQDDPNVRNISDQYLFGDDLMIAPILNATGKRKVYLPHGHWYDWWTGERMSGGRWISVEIAIDKMPIYIREGAVIPMGPVMNYIDEFKTHKIEVIIAPFETENIKSLAIPVNDSFVHLEYKFINMKHSVRVEKTDIAVSVTMLGNVSFEVFEF